MKKAILYSLVGLVLLFIILVKSELIYVGISPYAYYKLNETEAQLFDEKLFKIREKLETGDFEEVKSEFVDVGQYSRSGIYSRLKDSREKFGKSLSSEFFLSSPPERNYTYYKNLNGTYYCVLYFTKTESGEIFEVIDWIVTENNEAKMLNYYGGKIVEWQIKAREREKYVDLNYPNEIRIPFDSRFIMIRY